MRTLTPTSRRVRRRLAGAAGGVLAALVLCLAALTSTASATSSTTWVGGGSDVTFHIMSALDLLYNEAPGCNWIAPQGQTQPLNNDCLAADGTENTNHDIFTEQYPIGGSAGVKQLCQQGLAGVAPVSYARSTTAPGASVCHGLRYVAYARDGISWESFPNVAGSASANMNNQAGTCAGSNGFCLTQQQLNAIFVTCQITNWSQVGGANAPIKIYTPKPAYATRGAFDIFVGGNSSNCPGTTEITQTNNAEVPAGDRPNAIVGVSAATWTEKYGAGVAAPGGNQSTETTIKEVTVIRTVTELKKQAAKKISKRVCVKKKCHVVITWKCPTGWKLVTQGTKHLCTKSVSREVPTTTTTTSTKPVGNTTTEQGEPSRLGSIDGVSPNLDNIKGGQFPWARYVYNVYCVGDPANGNKCGGADPAPAGVVNYLGPDGWLCSAGAHSLNPWTDIEYHNEIVKTIRSYGFAELPLGPTGGGTATTNYCRLFTT